MPIVTISRMYGSGGSEVAQLVAEKLGWQLLDNELVDSVAARLGLTPAEVSAQEERVPSLSERLADTMSLSTAEWVVPTGDPLPPPSDEKVLEMTQRVIDEAVARSPVVLVGRGAQMSLATRADAIHVFCYAPRPALIARVMKRHECDAKEAERITDEMNKNREQYVKKHWKRSWSAHEHYDICVNTDRLGVEGAASLVTGLVQARTANRKV